MIKDITFLVKYFLFTLTFVVAVMIVTTTKVQAQQCLGGVTCCNSALEWECNDCDGDGIPDRDPFTQACICGGSNKCKTGTHPGGCGWYYGTCTYSQSTCFYISGGCYVQSCTWGAWGACSASCGGGTQTRNDNCGNVQTQACNPQPCETCSPSTFVPGPFDCDGGACVSWQRRNGIWKSTPSQAWSCSDSCVADVACACSGWVNGACGVGGCPPNQRQQTRTCSGGGFATTQCVADPTCAFPVSGTVYNDPNREAVAMGSICQLAGASGVQPGASSTVSTDFTSGPVTGAGTFSVNALGSPPDQLITLNLGPHHLDLFLSL